MMYYLIADMLSFFSLQIFCALIREKRDVILSNSIAFLSQPHMHTDSFLKRKIEQMKNERNFVRRQGDRAK